MTSPRRFESDLPVLLDDLYLVGTPDYRDDLVRKTARVRQRPAWTFFERWLPMELVTTRVPTTRMPWRQIGVLALLAVVLGATIAAYIGSQPRVPPPFGRAANGVVAYSVAGDIYAADPTTGSVRPIIAGPENDIGPEFSRDGTQIVFERVAPVDGDFSKSHIYVARSDGSGVTRVTQEPIALTMSEVGDHYQFSPDGRLLVMTARTEDGVGGILIAATDGSGTRWVDLGEFEDRVTQVTEASFRPPDGNQILFVGTDHNAANGGPGVYVVDPSTGIGRTIVEAAPNADLDAAVWSPDGSRISYATWTAATQLTVRTHVVLADGTGDRVLPAPSGAVWDVGAAWSNDGTRMLLVRGYTGTWETSRAVIMPVDGNGTGVEVVQPVPIQKDCCYHWEWSPDDSMILGTPTGTGGQALQQVIIDVDSATTRPAPWTSTAAPVWQRRAQ
jgi:hypothetical protein